MSTPYPFDSVRPLSARYGITTWTPSGHAHTPGNNRRLLISTRCMRGLSGKVIMLQNNIPALIAAGWDVTLLAEKLDKAVLRKLGARAARINGLAFNKTQKLKRFNHNHQSLMQGGSYDLVVSHGETLQQDVLHVHNCRHLEHEEICRERLFPGMKYAADLQTLQLEAQKFQIVVANSRLTKQDLMRRYDIDEDRIKVVYPGYDPARFKVRDGTAASHALRAELGIGQRQLIGLVTSGKLRQRGADILIEAFARLPAEVRNKAHLLIVASDDFQPYLDIAMAAGVADRTHFMPPREDVENYYHALDIYVNPARIETFGMALLEAMACGTAAITTRHKVGASELFTQSMQNALIPQSDSQALGETLKELLLGDAAISRHRQLCAQAARPHDWQSNINQHLQIYARAHWMKRTQSQLHLQTA